MANDDAASHCGIDNSCVARDETEYSQEGVTMFETTSGSLPKATQPRVEPSTRIGIISLDVDRTRRVGGSFTDYRVYFALSESPPQQWRDIFGREWTELSPTHDVWIDGQFLVMQCPLHAIATTHLPSLKKAVGATNIAYNQCAREQAVEEERQIDVWENERRVVE
jgi:hypothetical protein